MIDGMGMVLDVLLTTTEAAILVGVSAALIRKWASRGLLHAIRGLYRAGDVLDVDRRTRQTARRRGGPRRRTLACA